MVDTNKIKKRMEELALKQKDIGKALGIATPTVCQKLNNVRPMSLDEAEALATLLKIEDNMFGVIFFGKEIA